MTMDWRNVAAATCVAFIFVAGGQVEKSVEPPQIPDHIPRAQVFNKHMADPSALPNVSFVWGAVMPLKSARIIDSFYYPNQRDFDRSHTADWFKKNHPGWITYECDRTTPSYGYVYSWGAYVPLDTTNPEVRQYLMKTYIEPALKRGYRAIALDNVTLLNYDKRCGVWRDGQWVQLFSGEARDRAHTREKLDYIKWMADEIHRRGGLIALNAKIDPKQTGETQALVQLADIWVDEGGFSDHCRHRIVEDLWRLKRDLIRKSDDKTYVSINYLCAPLSFSLEAGEISWIVASFLVNRTNHSYLAVLGLGESGKWVENPHLDPPVGPPAGESQSDGDLVWRPYQKGYAVVNTSAKAPATFRVPPGSWKSPWGRLGGAEVELKPRSGLVLLSADGSGGAP